MKILWVKSDFLHPTTKGGQIRTLEILRRLHQRHEVHYVAFDDPRHPEGVARSSEYCSRAYPVRHDVPDKGSLAFLGQLATGLTSSLPVAIGRYRSAAMRGQIESLVAREAFDIRLCDFLAPAPNVDRPDSWVLFQHNVESDIWLRHYRHAQDPVRRFYFGLQARRMLRYEGKACRSAGRVIAVSHSDAARINELFQAPRVSVVPTGVDVDYFRPTESASPVADLVFVGSMDWLPNIDGVQYFLREIWPRILDRRPACTLAIVGRNPSSALRTLASSVPGVRVTGTVPDVRPFLWDSKVSIVPLRVGGGTRLKIYESMAAGVAVVSTTVRRRRTRLPGTRNDPHRRRPSYLLRSVPRAP